MKLEVCDEATESTESGKATHGLGATQDPKGTYDSGSTDNESEVPGKRIVKRKLVCPFGSEEKGELRGLGVRGDILLRKSTV